MARGSVVRDEEPLVEQQGLTAAASPISLDGTTWKTWRLGDTRWQMEAWRHFDICGELRFATNWMANAISRCRLYVSELDKYGRPDKEVNDEAIQVLAETMFGGPTLKAEAQRALGAHLYLTGESFIVAEDVAQASKDIWYVCSTSEVHRNGTASMIVDRSNIYGGGQHEMRSGRDLMMRVWTPHPRRYDSADSSVRAVLPILREIEGLTKKVFAQIDSRLAGAGLLFLPQELDFPKTDKDPPGARGLMSLLARNIAAALQDPSSAAALVPVMAQVPGDMIDKIKWQTFETPFQAETGEKLVQAIKRLATGLDIPPEVLLGQGETNHWSAWQIEESTIKVQIEPLLVRICDALTNGYLKAALKIIGKDPEKYVVWYDTAALAVRPNRQADAITLYGLSPDMISAEEVRAAGDWGESAAPSKKEYEKRLALDMVKLNPALLSNDDIQKALGIKWKIEDPNAAPPPEEAPPADQAALPPGEGDQTGLPPADQGGSSAGWLMDGDQRGLPQQPQFALAEGALLVGADMVVRRALERGGARLLTRARRGMYGECPAAELHTRVRPDAAEVGRVLADAFEPAAELAERVGMDPEVVTDMLTVYTTSLMAQGLAHDYNRFALYVDQALDLIGHGDCNSYCRNPLHPGPCKGWRQNLPGGTPTRAPRRDEPNAGPGTPRKAAKKAAKKAAPAAPDAPTAAEQRAEENRRTGRRPTAAEARAAENLRTGQRPELRAGEDEPAPEPIDPPKSGPELTRDFDAARQRAGAEHTPVVDNGGQIAADLTAAQNGDEAARQRVVEAAKQVYEFTDPGTGIRTQVVEVFPRPLAGAAGGGVGVRIKMFDANGEEVGNSSRVWRQRGDGKMDVRHSVLILDDHVQGGGFSRRWNAQAKQGYRDMGVGRITLTASDTVGGAAWASEGYDFADQDSMNDVANAWRRVSDRMQPDDPLKAQIDALIIRSTQHDFQAGTHPSPYEWYMLGADQPYDRRMRGRRTPIRSWLGKDIMRGTEWAGFYSITDEHRPQSRPEGVAGAAGGPGQGDPSIAEGLEQADAEQWDERGEFMQAVSDMDEAWAEAAADSVPVYPGLFGPPGEGNDYPANHHLFGADDETDATYRDIAGNLLDQWGRGPNFTDEPPEDDSAGDEQDGGLTAHAGCEGSRYCRAPLHPGPCRGWRQRERDLKPERARRREESERQRRARGATPAAPRKATPAKKAAPAKKAVPPPTPTSPVRQPRTPEQQSADQIAAETARQRNLLEQQVGQRVLPAGIDQAKMKQLIKDVAGGQSRYDYRTGRMVHPSPEAEDRAQRAHAELTQVARDIWQINDGPSGLRTEVRQVYTDNGRLEVGITIYDSTGRQVGTSTRNLGNGATGHGSGFQAYHAYLQLSADVQGGGFAERYNARAYQAYAELGVTHVGVHANIDVGGYTWATQGFDWESESDLHDMARQFRQASQGGGYRFPRGLGDYLTPEDRAEIDSLLARSTPEAYRNGTAPSPYEWAMVGRERVSRVPADQRVRAQWLDATPTERAEIEARATRQGAPIRWVDSWAGKTIMLGTSWHGSRPITRAVRPSGPTAFRRPADAGSPPVAGRTAPARRRRAVTAAAMAEETAIMDAFSERTEFLLAVAQLSLAYANTVAEQVPAVPEDANPNAGGQSDYAANHHMISADEEQTDAYLDLAEELMMEWGRDGADAGLTASAHSECTETFCRAPLHPGPCKRWRVKIKGGRDRRRRDLDEPRTGPAGDDEQGRRPSLADRLRRRRTEPAQPGDNPSRVLGTFSWRDNPWFEAVGEDTGEEGIPVGRISLPYGLARGGAGSYDFSGGTFWRFGGVAYLAEHGRGADRKAKARRQVERVRLFHEQHIAPEGGGRFQRGYSLLSDISDRERVLRAQGSPDGIIASAGDGQSTIWGVYSRGLPPQQLLTDFLQHEYGHNVARYGIPNEDRLDHSQEWNVAGMQDAADGGPQSRVVGLRVEREILRGKINGTGDIPGSPYPRGVSQYGTTSPGEDFAEAVMMYRGGQIGVGRLAAEPHLGELPIYFRDLFPARAAQLDGLFPEFADRELAEISRQRQQARTRWEQRA